MNVVEKILGLLDNDGIKLYERLRDEFHFDNECAAMDVFMVYKSEENKKLYQKMNKYLDENPNATEEDIETERAIICGWGHLLPKSKSTRRVEGE